MHGEEKTTMSWRNLQMSSYEENNLWSNLSEMTNCILK